MQKRIRVLQITVALLFVLCLFMPVVFAESEVIPNQITVLYEENDSYAQLDIDKEKIASVEHVTENVDVLTLKESKDTDELIEEVANDDGVRAADHEVIAKITAAPNDTYYNIQEAYLNHINYDKVEGGANAVKVAVLDTGVQANHEDLSGRVELSGYNYVKNTTDTDDPHNHGTSVAGIIAAQTNNSKGIAGASKTADVKIVPFTVLNSNGEGRLSDIAAALEGIATRNDIKVINMSFAYQEDNSVLQSIINTLASQNKLLVASSGNKETNQLYYPARNDNVFGVGACNLDNERCDESDWGIGSGSTYGEGLDILAPGDEIVTLATGSRYVRQSGTSFSVPFFSAACALAATYSPDISPNQVQTALASTSLDLYSPGWDQYSGYGLIQLDRFVNSLKSVPAQPSQPTNPENPDQVSVYRLYNSNNGEHLYTTNLDEVKAATGNGWTDEGRGWIAPASGEAVYRLYNPSLENHLYTMDLNEVEVLTTQQGWIKDFDGNPVFYSGGDVPIYRLYNESQRGLHHLTTDGYENEVLPQFGWKPEGIAMHAVAN